jgi:hypothetical protein
MRRVLIGTAAAGVLLTSLLTATSATAAEATSTPTDAGSSQLQLHCVADVDTGLTACADDDTTIAEARIAVAGTSSGLALRSPVHVATIYAGFLGQGGSLEIQAGADCTVSKTNIDWTLGNVGSAMNDETSSFQVYGNCRVAVYDAAYCPSGSARYPSTGYAGTTNYVGDAMNDRTTCVRGS